MKQSADFSIIRFTKPDLRIVYHFSGRLMPLPNPPFFMLLPDASARGASTLLRVVLCVNPQRMIRVFFLPVENTGFGIQRIVYHIMAENAMGEMKIK